jgi:hypothetical protein
MGYRKKSLKAPQNLIQPGFKRRFEAVPRTGEPQFAVLRIRESFQPDRAAGESCESGAPPAAPLQWQLIK